jgi:hypothetical protein
MLRLPKAIRSGLMVCLALSVAGGPPWRQRLAGFSEHRDRLAAVSGEPGVVVGIDGCAEGATLHPARRQSPW